MYGSKMTHITKFVTPKNSRELMDNAVANQDPKPATSGNLKYSEDVRVRVPDQRLV